MKAHQLCIKRVDNFFIDIISYKQTNKQINRNKGKVGLNLVIKLISKAGGSPCLNCCGWERGTPLALPNCSWQDRL